MTSRISIGLFIHEEGNRAHGNIASLSSRVWSRAVSCPAGHTDGPSKQVSLVVVVVVVLVVVAVSMRRDARRFGCSFDSETEPRHICWLTLMYITGHIPSFYSFLFYQH